MTSTRTPFQNTALRCLSLAVIFFLTPAAFSQAPQTQSTPESKRHFGKLSKAELEQLRKKYAFKSVRDRLSYEAKAARPPASSLSEEADKAVEWMDRVYDQRRASFQMVRAKSLQMLHEGEVKDFAQRPGFGVSRVPGPSPRYFELPTAPPLHLTQIKVQSATEDSLPLVRLPKLKETKAPNPLRLPSLDLLGQFHLGSQYGFISPPSLGYVKSPDQVSGFLSHQFFRKPDLSSYMPKLPPEHAKEKWQIRRLQLVGLLKHAKPIAYVSEHLPRMEELREASVRPLDAFERNGLAELRKGKQIVTQATPNRIYMLGALRASKQCTQCHSVKRGGLLGAFSYELWRDPQIKVQDLKKQPLY